MHKYDPRESSNLNIREKRNAPILIKGALEHQGCKDGAVIRNTGSNNTAREYARQKSTGLLGKSGKPGSRIRRSFLTPLLET